jgi:membrane protein required for colicin V production
VTPGWPDLVIGGITLYFAWKGFRNGFVAELAGPFALIIAVVAAFRYPGSLDADVSRYTNLGPGSAHAVGTILFAVLVYVVVSMIAWVLDRIASLPGIGIVNSAGGAVIGGAKALLGVWVVLYLTLFFPLTDDLRSDLHRSPLVQLVTAPDAAVDADAYAVVPQFIRPLVDPFFARHHI